MGVKVKQKWNMPQGLSERRRSSGMTELYPRRCSGLGDEGEAERLRKEVRLQYAAMCEEKAQLAEAKLEDLRKEVVYRKTALAGCRQALAKCDANEAELLQKLEEADLGILRRKEELVSLQDSIGRRRDALWAIHPALVSLQEEEDLKNEKKLEEKGEEVEVKEDEKHLERVGEKVEEGPEEKEKREGMAWLEMVEERSKLSFDEVLGIVTKNKKKKEREAALKIKKETGARKKENSKGSETKVVRRPSATAEPSDMMVMKLSLVMEEVESFRESVERKGADLSRALLRGRVRLGMAEERCADDTKRLGSMASMMGVELERVPSADGASGVTEEVKSSS